MRWSEHKNAALTYAWSGPTTLLKAWTWPFKRLLSACNAFSAAVAAACAHMDMAL